MVSAKSAISSGVAVLSLSLSIRFFICFQQLHSVMYFLHSSGIAFVSAPKIPNTVINNKGTEMINATALGLANFMP